MLGATTADTENRVERAERLAFQKIVSDLTRDPSLGHDVPMEFSDLIHSLKALKDPPRSSI